MWTRVTILLLVFGLILAQRAEAQTAKSTSEQKTPVAAPQEPDDPLGRNTPRSAVIAFFKAIRKENYERAEQYVPEPLRSWRWLSIPLYQWIQGLPGHPLIVGMASILTRLLQALLRPLLRRLTHELDDRRLAIVAWPLRLQVVAFLVYGTSRYGASVVSRGFWASVAITLTVLAVMWLLVRLGDVITDLWTRRLLHLNRSVDIMLVRLINRLGKVAVVTVSGLLLLHLSGVNLTAVLTGLGLGGIAVAFAAQKTLENLFGGIMVISDKPIQVGDFCRA